MTNALTSRDGIRTVADLLERLGGIAPDRVWFHPAPGTAKEADVILAEGRENRLCELVEGTLVEKAMGFRESLLAVAIAGALREFILPRNLGVVTGSDGFVRLFPGLVRIPDVAFASWDRFPGRKVPAEPLPDLAPDLAVEVLSKSNTKGEMTRKRRDYFAAGTRLVWEVDPETRTVDVFTGDDARRTLVEEQTLDGGTVLPGFELPLKTLFSELDRTGSA